MPTNNNPLTGQPPKRVEVLGVGIVEFPADMSEAAITEVLSREFPKPQGFDFSKAKYLGPAPEADAPFDFSKARYLGPNPERNAFAVANDTAIDVANSATGMVKAGVDLFAPDSAVSSALGDFIKSGEQKQSDWKQASREQLARDLQAADGEWSKAGAYLKHATTEDPLGTVAQVAGNMAPFAAVGRALQGASAATRTATMMGMGGGLTAGEVRGNTWQKINDTPDAELIAASREYASLREVLSEADAKREIGAQFLRNLPEVGIAGAIGALGGKFGLEGMVGGVAPRYGGRLLSGAVGVADEASQGAVEQLASNFGVRRALPEQALWEDVALNAAQEGILGVGAVARPGVRPQTPEEILIGIINGEDNDGQQTDFSGMVGASGRGWADSGQPGAADQPNAPGRDDGRFAAGTFAGAEFDNGGREAGTPGAGPAVDRWVAGVSPDDAAGFDELAGEGNRGQGFDAGRSVGAGGDIRPGQSDPGAGLGGAADAGRDGQRNSIATPALRRFASYREALAAARQSGFDLDPVEAEDGGYELRPRLQALTAEGEAFAGQVEAVSYAEAEALRNGSDAHSVVPHPTGEGFMLIPREWIATATPEQADPLGLFSGDQAEALTITRRATGELLVSGPAAREKILAAVPGAKMMQRGDGSVLVGRRHADQVEAALASVKPAGYAERAPDAIAGDIPLERDDDGSILNSGGADSLGRRDGAGRAGAEAGARPVLAVRQSPDEPGIYHVRTQLVTTGERDLPVDRVQTWQDSARVFSKLSRFAVEHMDGLVTDSEGRPLALIGSFKGGPAQATIDVATLVGELSKIDGAAGVWLAHNHPSGDPELSDADRRVAQNLAELLRDSGVTFHGLAALGREGGTVRFSTTEHDTGEVAADEPGAFRVPIVEREIVEANAGEAITGPAQAKRLVQSIARDNPGVVFVDAQNRVSAFVPVESAEMGELRRDGRLMRLFRAASTGGATGAIIAMPGDRVSVADYQNVGKALGVAGVRVLDGIRYDSTDGPAESLLAAGIDSPAPSTAFKAEGDVGGSAGVTRPQAARYLEQAVGRTAAKALLDTGAVTFVDSEADLDRLTGAKRFATKAKGLLAPNGKPSKLNPVQWHLVRTPAFKAWFGDWENDPANASKAIDRETGEPAVLWHGSTRAGFSEFTPNEHGLIWASSNQETAASYAGSFDQADLWSGSTGKGLVPVFVNVRDPAETDAAGEKYYTFPDVENLGYTDWFGAQAKRNGKDGAVIRNIVDDGGMLPEESEAAGDDWVVFDSRQVKSAVGSIGTFDPKNPDIRYSQARTPIFFSQLARAFEQAPDRIFGPASQVKAWLASNAAKLQVKKDEIEWTGLNDWLDLQGKQKVTKQQVLDYLQQNGVQVEEVMKGASQGVRWERNRAYSVGGEYLGTLEDAGDSYGFVFADDSYFDTGASRMDQALAAVEARIGESEKDNEKTQYGSYVLPGGENYRELLLTLPDPPAIDNRLRAISEEIGNPETTDARVTELRAERDRLEQQLGEKKLYKSSHWTEPNILAHVRFNDRTDADGNKVLFIEELQSDWGQDGKKKGFDTKPPVSKKPSQEERDALLRDMRQKAKAEIIKRTDGGIDEAMAAEIVSKQPKSQVAEWAGLSAEWQDLIDREWEWDQFARNPGVPSAPFVTKTESWLDLGLKRMIAYAVEHGYDKIAFVNGEQSAERYDLSKQVDQISIGSYSGGGFQVVARKDGEVVLDRVAADEKELESLVGKDIAKKHIETKQMTFKGLDLKVGGSGMKAFYDQMVPQRVSAVLKKLGGGKVETVKVGGELSEQWGIYDATDSENQGLLETHPTMFDAQLSARDNFDNSGIEIRQIPKYGEQLGFTVTPEMKEKVAQGQPLFSRNLGATLPDGRIALVLENLDDSNFEAVLQHEALHATLRSLIGEATYTRLTNNLSEQLRLGKGAAWVKAAAAAVPANTPAAHRTEEIAAYAVQQYAEGAKLANPLRLWVEKFLAGLRAGILRFAPNGRVKDWAARTVTPATLSKLAIAGLKAKAAGKLETTTLPATRYSQSATTDPQTLRAKAKGWIAQNRGWMLGALTRDQLADIYGNEIPEAGEFDHVAQKMDQARNILAERADEIIERWRRLSTEEADRLADVMHGATIEQFDPADPQAAPSGIEQRAIAKAWAALTPEAKALYREVRDTYEGTLVRMRNGLSKRAERAGTAGKRIAAQIRLEFDKALSRGPYFPLSRFGDLLLIGRSPTGERTVEAFESGTARDARAAELRRAGYSIKLTARRDYNAATDAPAADFVGQVLKLIDGTAMDAKQKSTLMDDLNQLSIAMLPDQSARKHFAHRKAVPGFSQDAMRAFAASMQHAGHHLARVLHGDELQLTLDGLHKRLAEAKGDADLTEAQQVANELGRRLEYMLNPNTHPVAAALGQVGFVMSLGGSVAAGLVNLTQTPLVTFPWLGAKFGWGAASQALSKASKDYFAGKWDRWSGFVVKDSPALTADERQAMRELEDAGLVNLSQAHDLAGVANTDRTTSRRAFAVNRAMKMVSWTFHLPEVFNRQVSGLAAYRLARSAGKSHEAAVELAGQTLRRTHFDYSASNRARWMQGNVARVVTMFKQYSQNMTYALWRNAYLALKSETPEVRREARRMLLGVGAMHFAAAGSLGLPLGVFGISPLLGLLALGMGDDDTPWDWEVEYRNWLADTFGKAGGEAIAKGPARLLVDVDIASRVGLGELWVRPPQGEHEGRDLVEAWMVTLAGPVAGYVGNLGTAAQAFNEGKFSRGVEALVPKFIRDPLKALRYEREGVTSWKGDDLGVNLDGGDLFAQAIGFQPAALAEMFEGRAAVKGREARLQNRASELRRMWVEASLAGDQGMRAEVLDQVKSFNAKNPAMRITGQSLRQAVATKRRNAQQIEDGVFLTKKRESLREAGRFANVQRNDDEE